jgi:Phosphoenolpyruvate carboxylase
MLRCPCGRAHNQIAAAKHKQACRCDNARYAGAQGGLRVTEQGEMVHSKFGSPDIAKVTMESFTTAVLEATLCPPPPPRSEAWRDIMEELGTASCEAYRCAPAAASFRRV